MIGCYFCSVELEENRNDVMSNCGKYVFYVFVGESVNIVLFFGLKRG